jgi:ABC-2 type transport system permease protein
MFSRRSQLTAIAWLRWRLFLNALRSTRGQLELLTQVFISLAFAGGGFGGAALMGTGAYIFLTIGKPELLALLLWGIFSFWQIFPILATAFANNPECSDLLRFPLAYRSYLLVRLAYSFFDPATFLGSLWSIGILVGLTIAKPVLFPWAAIVLLTFVAFNLLLMQTIAAWVDRWLAQRRTREVMSILFVLLMLSFQLIGPFARHFRRSASPATQQFVHMLVPAQRILPPGLAADAIVQGIYPQWPAALSSLLLLDAFCLIAAYGLHVRLLAQYRGENLSEAAKPSTLPGDRMLHTSWKLPGFSTPIAAVFEKEIRYLLGSGPMLLSFAMPIFMLFIFRFGTANPARRPSGFLTRVSSFAFPIAAAYTLLMLTNLVYNTFGGDAGGVLFFYASPVRFSEIVRAKNLAHIAVLALDTALAWIVVALLYGRPTVDITMVTLAGLLFAVPLDFAAGNLLSLYSPKKLDYSRFGRQRASQITVLFGILLQIIVAFAVVAAFLLARYFLNFWIAALALGGLAIASLWIYITVLHRVDRLAIERQETLVTELCRA